LFSNLPRSLSILTFNDLRPHFERQTVIQHLLNCVPQISELNFVECSRAVVGTAIKAIGRPLHSSVADYGQLGASADTIRRSSGPVLPNLCKLSITNAAGWAILDKVEGQDIVEMLDVLYMANRNRGRFELRVDPESSWDHGKKVLGRLKGLVRDGFDVEVVTGTRTLDLS
jgi:hypothetical protein